MSFLEPKRQKRPSNAKKAETDAWDGFGGVIFDGRGALKNDTRRWRETFRSQNKLIYFTLQSAVLFHGLNPNVFSQIDSSIVH